MCLLEGPRASIRWWLSATNDEAVCSLQFAVCSLQFAALHDRSTDFSPPCFPVFVLGLFLFEQAAESADGVGGILPLRLRLGGAGGGSAGAAKLRLEQAGGETANIGNEFRIGSCAMNQERHGCRTAFTSSSGARDLSQETAKSASSSIGRAVRGARRRSRRVGEGCHHFEIEIVLGVNRAGTDELAERGDDRQEIVSPYPIRCHVEIAGELFDVQIPSGLDAGEHRDGGHFRTEIEANKLCVVKADGASCNDFVGGTRDREIGVERTALQRCALGKINTERRKKGLEIFRGHIFPFQLDVYDGGLTRGAVSAVEAREGAADFERGGIEDASVLAKVVFGVEIHGEGNAGGRAARDEQ